MTLPDRVRDTITAFVARFPIPQMSGPGPSDDAFENVCRAWMLALAEQIRYVTGDPAWGVKNAGGGRPQSKDSISYAGERLWNFDILTGVGTGHPALNIPTEGEDIAGQSFMPVQPVDHLGVAPPQGPPTDDQADDVDLVALLTAINERLTAIEGKLGAPVPVPLVQFPNYQGRIFGQPFTLKPVK